MFCRPLPLARRALMAQATAPTEALPEPTRAALAHFAATIVTFRERIHAACGLTPAELERLNAWRRVRARLEGDPEPEPLAVAS